MTQSFWCWQKNGDKMLNVAFKCIVLYCRVSLYCIELQCIIVLQCSAVQCSVVWWSAVWETRIRVRYSHWKDMTDVDLQAWPWECTNNKITSHNTQCCTCNSASRSEGFEEWNAPDAMKRIKSVFTFPCFVVMQEPEQKKLKKKEAFRRKKRKIEESWVELRMHFCSIFTTEKN